MKKKLYIIPFQHNDLVWRRGFRRDIKFNGENYIPYRDIEKFYIEESLNLAEKYPEYKFQIECVAVLREFLQDNPQYKDKIQTLLDKGRIYIPFSGDNIVDSNLIGGESLVRNFLYGYEYLKDNFNYSPHGIDRLDAFGNSGQLPQIARGFGEKWVSNISYSPCEKDYFKGIDGSVVYAFKADAVGMEGGGVPKYRPCKKCDGDRTIDCDLCNNRRIDEEYLNTYGGLITTPIINREKINQSTDICYITSGGEEIIPNDGIVLWARDQQEFDAEFATFYDLATLKQDKIDRADSPDIDDIFARHELNCNNTGVYVSRIKTKQSVRQLENLITFAETLSVANCINGKKYPKDHLQKIWEKAHFAMFHDCITGTVVDCGYEEIIDAIDSATVLTRELISENLSVLTTAKDGTVSVYNPYGTTVSTLVTATVKTDRDITIENTDIFDYTFNGSKAKITFYVSDLAPFSTREYTVINATYTFKATTFDYEKTVNTSAVLQSDSTDIVTATENNYAIIENEHYKISATECGVCEIFSKYLNTTIAKHGDCYIGEWVLESDFGSPWATLSRDRRRQPMSPYTKLTAIEKTDTMQRFVFKVTPDSLAGYSICGSEVTYTVTLLNNAKMIFFNADVRWDEQNMRYRVAFPTNTSGKHIYEIPYGTIERKPYCDNIIKDNGSSNWSSACGDYPAHNFAGIEGKDYSIALFNKGTPCYLTEIDTNGNDVMFITPLRSPSIATYLHSPREYSMTDYDGMRDVGQHTFSFGINVYANGFYENSAVTDGIGFNAELCAVSGVVSPPQLPTINTENVRISALKHAEKTDAIVIRLVEYHGKNDKITLNLPIFAKSIALCDLKEENRLPLKIENGAVKIQFSPYEIKTVIIDY